MRRIIGTVPHIARWLGPRLGVFALAMTSTSIAHAFRTLRDEIGDNTVGEYVWPKHETSFVVQDPSSIGLDAVLTADAVNEAFGKWSAATNASVTASYLGICSDPPKPDDGVNTIGWISQGWESLPTDSDAAGYTDILLTRNSNATGRISEADIYINAQTWRWRIGMAAEYRDLRAVLLHEVGHFLGLSHPCESGSTAPQVGCVTSSGLDDPAMWPIFSNTRLTLSEDDEAGMAALYPVDQECSPNCGSGYACIGGACHLECGKEYCGAAEICSDGGCKVPTARACSDSAVCPNGGECLPSGECSTGTAELGDPCSRGVDCRTGACSAGHCNAACLVNTDCFGGTACEAQRGTDFGVCGSSRLGLGEACLNGDECLSGHCLEGLKNGPVCTRACVDRSCPNAWECQQVGAVNLCVPDQGGHASCTLERHQR